MVEQGSNVVTEFHNTSASFLSTRNLPLIQENSARVLEFRQNGKESDGFAPEASQCKGEGAAESVGLSAFAVV
jgi:hypothetical protein